MNCESVLTGSGNPSRHDHHNKDDTKYSLPKGKKILTFFLMENKGRPEHSGFSWKKNTDQLIYLQ